VNWLLLRGLAREQRHWGAFPERLASVTNRAFVTCLDLPGAGTERHRDSPTTIAGIVADLRARFLPVRDAHPGPWALAAQSLGGMVTMQWAATHPGDFARVAVANTSASDLSPIHQRMDLAVVPQVFAAMADLDPVDRETRILGFTTALVEDKGPIARYFATLAADRPMRRANVLRQLVAASRFKAPGSLQVPILVLAAANDRLAAPACGTALATHFGAPMELHPTGGHDLALDDPEWLADRLAEWDRAGTPKA